MHKRLYRHSLFDSNQTLTEITISQWHWVEQIQVFTSTPKQGVGFLGNEKRLREWEPTFLPIYFGVPKNSTDIVAFAYGKELELKLRTPNFIRQYLLSNIHFYDVK